MVSKVTIRRQARAAGVPFWQIARALGIGEATMTRKLRTELSDTDKNEILAIISELASANDEEGEPHGTTQV